MSLRVVLLLLLLSPCAGATEAAAIALAPCELEHPLRLSAISARCGWLAVPENPQRPHERQIRLFVARVAAVSRRPRADPLLILAGGPGLAATTFYASVASAFEPIRRDRDIVLIDQRGTGRSNRLDCALDEAATVRRGSAELEAEARRCLETLHPHADVRAYTSSVASEDLERVRLALGLARVNLYASSYGTRVAQLFLRHHPRETRSVILDGVLPVEVAVGPSTALDAEAALASVLDRCSADPSCQRAFGEPVRSYGQLRARLASQAVAVSVADPATGAPVHVSFGARELATVLRLSVYGSEQAALLPLLLSEGARSHFEPLAAQLQLLQRDYGTQVAFGMHNSVVCTEDVPFYDAHSLEAARSRIEQTFLGFTQVEGLEALCHAWPQGLIDSDLHAPLRSPVPALLLSGGADPVTPAAWGERAARSYTEGTHLILPGFGHGQLTLPCVQGIMARFVARGRVRGLDTTCLAHARPLPFFTSAAGPAP